MCWYHETFHLNLDHTPWMHAYLEIIMCEFGGDPAICLVEAICAKSLQTDTQMDAVPLH